MVANPADPNVRRNLRCYGSFAIGQIHGKDARR